MIVCSCNVLSDKDILATVASEDSARPRTPVQAYLCLGCAPRCGRCLPTVRALLTTARVKNCEVGCATCPGAAEHRHAAPQPEVFLVAAE